MLNSWDLNEKMENWTGAESQKKQRIFVEKRHLKDNIIWYALYSKCANFTDFQKSSFFQKHIFFQKKNYVRIWEIFLFQSHSTANFQ